MLWQICANLQRLGIQKVAVLDGTALETDEPWPSHLL